MPDNHHIPVHAPVRGTPITEETLDRLAREAENGYDITQLRPRRVWRRRRWWWPTAVAVGFLMVQVLLAPSSMLYPDSAQYARIALRYLGEDYATAVHDSAVLYCGDMAKQTTLANAAMMVPSSNVDGDRINQQCVADNSASEQFTGQPRYRAIFESRPGFPLALAALSPVVGMRIALWVVPVMATLLAGLLVWWTLAVLGVRPPMAAAGQAALYLLPIGTWGVQALTEGPVLLGVTAAMAGAVAMVMGRLRSGVPLLLAGLAVTTAVKYSTALPLACGLAAAAGLAQLVSSYRRLTLGLLSGIGILATVAIATTAGLLGMPSVMESVQDAFTNHFTQPDVSDGWSRLASANLRYWEHWPAMLSSNILLAAATVLAAWALWRRYRPVALIVLACAALGVVLTAVHPDLTQGDRLYSLLWLAPIIGIPVAAQRVSSRSTPSRSASPSGVDQPLPAR